MSSTVLIVLSALLVAVQAKCVCISNEDEGNSYRIKVGEALRFVDGQPLSATKRCHDEVDFFHFINGTWFAIPQQKDIKKWWAGLRMYKTNVIHNIYINVVDRDWKVEEDPFKAAETTTIKTPKPWRPTTTRPDSTSTSVPAVSPTEKVCRPVTPTSRTTKLLPTSTTMMPSTTTTRSPVSTRRAELVTPPLTTTSTLAPTTTPTLSTTTTTEVMTPTTTTTTTTSTTTMPSPTQTTSTATPPTTTPTSSIPSSTPKLDSPTTADFVLETTSTVETRADFSTPATTTTPVTSMPTSLAPLPSTTASIPVVPVVEDNFPFEDLEGLFVIVGVVIGILLIAKCVAFCRGRYF